MATYAVIRTGGKQYLVTPGQTIDLPLLKADAGKAVVFDQVLMIAGDATNFGQPTVSGAKVTATVIKHDRTVKVTGVKFHNKVRYRRTYGHRQDFTRVKIERIA
jgi:large subunit ribosomal protein L21